MSAGRTLPDLIDALVAAAKAASWANPVTVCDGLPTVLASGDYLVIGLDDWDERGTKASSGTSTEDWSGATMGGGIDETGSISCVAWARDGASVMKTARDRAYLIHTGLRSICIAALAGHASAFGIPGLWDVRVGGVEELSQIQSEDGAIAAIRFPIAYQARIPEE